MALSAYSEANALLTLPPNTGGGTMYWELPGYAEQFSPEATSATRRLMCYWRDRKQFLLDILGDATITGDAGSAGAKLHRLLPHRHPDFSFTGGNFFDMWAVEATFVQGGGWPGRDPTTGFIQFNDAWPVGVGDGVAIYDVRYAPTLYEVASDEDIATDPLAEQLRWVVPINEPAGENLDVPKGLLVYSDNKDAPPLAPQLFPTAMISRQWVMVPEAGFREDTVLGYQDGGGAYIYGAMGSLNDAVFLGKPAGTLLGLAPTVRRYMHANTQIYLDLTFHWQYRPAGHNRVMRNSGVWEYLYRRGGTLSGGPLHGPFPLFSMKTVFDVSSR